MRLPASLAARALIVCASVGVVSLPAAAHAQTATPTPVIDRYPRRVSLQGSALVAGHLENGAPGDEVSLERRGPTSRWRIVATKPIDEESRVRFRLRGLRTSASYRLVWQDEIVNTSARSRTVRIRVTPKLGLRVSPDDAFAGRRVVISGGLYPSVHRRRWVLVQRRHRGAWHTIAKEPVRRGRFSTTFRPRNDGRKLLRVRFVGDDLNTAARRWRRLRVYRRGPATWYGPGFYGRTTACGRRLDPGTLGVAHRTMPCGTDIRLLYRGRTISVEVIDRGPYSSADWDLTEETAERLRFRGRDMIGVTRSR
jgi:rare lipoprotein A